MSLQSALDFIAWLRTNPELAAELRRGGSLDAAAERGRGLGYDFSAEELRLAHQSDWTLRAARAGISRAPGAD